ncbi:MAG: hypothetical protein ACRDJH_12125 [Thermomicrobiales bacterium]
MARVLVVAVVLATLCGLMPGERRGAAQDETIRLEETFDDPNTGIFTEGSSELDEYVYAYEEGKFVIAALADDFQGELISQVLLTLSDATIAVDARPRGEVTGRHLVVGCRGLDADTGYELEVNTDFETVTLWRGEGAAQTEIAGPLLARSIRGLDHTNRIELSCTGSTITASINGDEVVSVEDERFEDGLPYVGAGLYGSSSGPFEAIFDNLVVTAPSPAGTREARAMANLAAEARAEPSIFGPEAGEIELTTNDALDTSAFANANARDFYLTVAFTNPYPAAAHPWDIGIAFRGAGNADHYRLVIDSHRRWYLVLGTEELLVAGLVVDLDLDDGGVNEVELAARGDVGYLAVNGSFVTALDLSERDDPGDVWVSAGFFPEDVRRSGEMTPYDGFEIWELVS